MVVDAMGKSAQATSNERRPAERALREPIIPQSPRVTEGDKTFVVLPSAVATVSGKKQRRKP
jgi:hypothetical protein